MVLSRNDKRKRKEGDIVDLMDPLAQGPKRTKFQAQRKFASVQCSPVVSPAKEPQEKTKGQPVCNELITHKRPNTADFLTFLCYRAQKKKNLKILPSQQIHPKSVLPILSKQTQLVLQVLLQKVVPVKEKPVAKKKDVSPPKPIKLKTTSTAAQALKKKYQEQRLKKLKPTSMKTRSRGSSDPPKPIAKSVSQKKVVIPKVVKRHSLRSNVSLETEAVSPPVKKQSVSQSKKRSSNSKENDDSESSSPKIEKETKIEEEKRVTRSAPRPVSPARRPTRKTKEAAAIYMEILGRKLVGSDLENEDNMSVDSFPELPNARKTAQTENELKLKNRGSKSSKDKENKSVISGRVAKQKPSPGVSLRNKRLTREQISETINDSKIAKRKSLGSVSPLKSKRTARVHKYCELDSEDDEESFTSEETSSAATPAPKPEVIKTRKSAPAAIPSTDATDNNKKKETTTTPRSSRSSITSKKATTVAADAFAKPAKTTTGTAAAAAAPKETAKETAKATKDNKPSPVKRSKEKDKEKAKAKSTATAKASEESEEEESLSSLIDKLNKKKESEKTSSPAATAASAGGNKETIAQETTTKKIKSILDVKLPQRGAELMKKFVSDDEESFRGFTQRSINGAHALLDEAIGTKNPSILKTHEAMKAQETNKKPDMKAVFGCVLEPIAAAAEKVVVVGSSSSSPTTSAAKLAPKAAAAAVGTSSNNAIIVGNHHHHHHPVKVESDEATKSMSDALLPQQQQQQLKPQSRCVGSKLTSLTTTTTMPNCGGGGGGAPAANVIEMPSSMTMMMMSSHHGHRKERVNMSTEQIEKWLNESSLAKEESKVEMESVASSFKYEPPPITTATATSSSSSSAIAASLPSNNHHHHHHHHRQHHHYHQRYHQPQQPQQPPPPSPHHQHVHSLPIVTTGHHLSISPRIQHLVRPVNVTLSKLSDRLKHQQPPVSAAATGSSSSFFGRSTSTATIGGKVTAAAAATATTTTTSTTADSSGSIKSLSTVALTSTTTTTTTTTTKTAMAKPASSRGSSKETTPTTTNAASYQRKMSKDSSFGDELGGIASDKKHASTDQAKDATVAKRSADSKMTASAAGKSSKHLNLPQEARKSAASSSGGSNSQPQPTTPKTFELPKNFADLTNIQVLPLDKLTTSWSDVNCSASIAVQVNLDPQLQKSEKSSSSSSHAVEAAASSSTSSAAASVKKSLGAATSKPSTKGSSSTVTAAVAGAGREKTAAAADKSSTTSSSRTPPKSSTIAVVDQSEDQTTTDDDDNSSGQLFYIPLQAVARNCSAQGGQQLIQGVAVKLGTEGPQGPNQKVLLKAKLVTKPPVTVARCPPIGTVQPTARVTQSSGSQQQVPSTSSVGVAAAAATTTTTTTTDAGFKTPKDRVMKTIVDSKRIHKSPTPEKLVKPTGKTATSSGVERNKVPADGAKTSSSKKPSSKTKTDHYQPVNATSFPCTQDSKENVKLVEAPIFRPSEKDFQDPLEYIDKIRPIAEKFGICKVVPPANFKPECKVSDDMRFTAYNHYIHRMLNRWGPNVREMMAIKKYLATQSISLTQAPWIGGMEVDLPYLYQTVQTLGGLKEVIEKKKWQKVADGMKIPRSAQDRVTKIDDIYCKYLLPYDTLSQGEREKLFKEVEADWVKKESRAERRSNDESDNDDDDDDDDDDDSSSEEIEECIVKGRNMPLNAFYRIARNTQRMWFGERQCSPSGESEGASAAEVEAAFWKHVVEKRRHVCVHAASIDSGGRGFGFSQAKNSPFARHPWNLKVLTNNAGSVLRALGPQMGVTVPTLHVGMVFSTCCWYRDPHCLPWIEYLHTGAKKIWYGIPDTESEALRDTLARMFPRYCKSTKIWLPSDTAMVPPDMLVRNGVPLCQTVQEPGQFIVVFPKAFTSSICTGYVVSESVYFAHPSWLDTAEQVFQDLHDSCEPSMFSFEKLLFSIINDAKTSTDVLRQILPSVSRIYNREVENRRKLKELGLTKTEKLPLPENDKKAKKKALQEEADYECDTCRANLYVSCVSNPTEEAIFCLTHAIPYIERKKSVLKNCTLIYTYSEVRI
ncbi:unnamed protein product [Trichogramma brassicae]|uniref:Protein Jumonji n=1 Tax=Trichogramma brassicae TaxID=86971 RepID=A0A6H5ID82_9HYME|nr:unnamed protein product [Trichogramma brassicae]